MNRASEPVVHAGRIAHDPAAAPGGRTRGTAIDDDGIGAIMAVSGQPAAAGAQIVVRIAMINGPRTVDVPAEVLIEAMLPRQRQHLGRIVGAERIVVVLSARIAGGPASMCPAEADVILRVDVL